MTEEPFGVLDLATRFRRALEEGGFSLPALQEFPNGACGDASELLGQFLFDNGLGVWYYRSAQRLERFQTHAWLESGDWLLDITADQFPQIHAPVILTRDHTWHDEQFPVHISRRPANLRWSGDPQLEADTVDDLEVLKARMRDFS